MKLKGNLLKSVFMLFLMALFSVIFLQNSYAAVYKYTNRVGNESYTDNPDSIPAELRKKAVKMDKYGGQEAGPESTGAVDGEKGEKPGTRDIVSRFFGKISDSRLYKTGIAFGVLIIVFIAAGKIGEAVGGRHVSTILRIVVTVGLLVFLYYLYSKEMVDTYKGIKERITGVKDMKEDRDRKMTDTVNQLFPEPEKKQ